MQNLYRLITEGSSWLNTSRALTVSDLEKRIILLDFWTFCCINCLHVLPDLHALEDTFKDTLTVIGIHSGKFSHEQGSEAIRDAILRHDIHHPVINDADFHVWNSFGVRAWPSLILINPDGMIEQMYSGEGHRERLRADISYLLKRYQGRVHTTPLPLAPAKEQPSSLLSFPTKVTYAADTPQGALLFIADNHHHRIVAVRPDGRIQFTIGSGLPGFHDGDFKTAQFRYPQGMLYHDNTLYIADTGNHSLRAIDLQKQQVTTLAGTGKQGMSRVAISEPARKTSLNSPWDLTFYPDHHTIILAMAGSHQLWAYDMATKTVSVVAGNGREFIDDGMYPVNSLSQPSGVSAFEHALYFVDAETSSLRAFEHGYITTLIGKGLFDFGKDDGDKDEALMQHPIGLAAYKDGVLITDSYNHMLRHYDPRTGLLSTLAGSGEKGDRDGEAAHARFNEPQGITQGENLFYIADTNNHRIRIWHPQTHTVTTLPLLPEEESLPINGPSDALPQLISLPQVQVKARYPIEFSLELSEGWELNPDASSFLILYERTLGIFKPIASYDVSRLRSGNIALPPLDAGTYYRLQGSFYSCATAQKALCRVDSMDQVLEATTKTANTCLSLVLKGDVP